MRIKVRVQPRASREKIVRTGNAELKVYLRTPPVDGRANKALRELLSEYFQVSKSNVRILKGETSKDKLVEIT